MVVSKITELLGTKSLSSSDALFVYNSEAFANKAIVAALGFSEEVGKLLTEVPTTSTIDDFYVLLEATGAFETLQKEETPEGEDTTSSPLSFIYRNDPLSVVSGYGFNTIIYLRGQQIIGFTVLLNPIGATITTKGQSYYSLSKNYTVGEVHITISTEEDKDIVSINSEQLTLFHKVESQARITKPVGFATDPTYETKRHNYQTKINSLLKNTTPHEIFTDSSIIRGEKGELTLSKLSVIKGIVLDERYKYLTNKQVGLYKGDIVLYLWKNKTIGNNNTESPIIYTILSLTKSMEEISGISGLDNSPITYTSSLKDLTTGKYVSKNCMCELPEFSEEDPVSRIIEFQGPFARVELKSGETRVFDITRQGTPRYEGFPYNKGWVIKEKLFTGRIIPVSWDSNENMWVNGNNNNSSNYYENVDLIPNTADSRIKEYEITFLTDFILDSKGKLIKNTSWKSMQEAREEFPQLTNTYADLTIALGKYEGAKVVQRLGDWIKIFFPEDQTYLYTNMRTCVKIGAEEIEPIVINSSSMMTVEENEDLGTVTYTLYRNSGNFITKTLAKRLYSWTETTDVVMKNDYIHGTWEIIEAQDLIFTINIGNVPDLPKVLGDGFLNRYRRNIVPMSLEKFHIIGAVEGLIFYEQEKNIVNLL